MFSVNSIESIKVNQIKELLNISRTQAYYLKKNQREMSLLDYILIAQYDPDHELVFFNWSASNLLFWNNLNSLQESLVQTDETMAQYFFISLRKYRYFRACTKSLPWQNCLLFFKKYHFHPIHFFSPDIDIECLSKIIKSPFSKTSFLPQVFEGGGSKMRTLSNCFDFIKDELGAKTSKALLHALQITDHSLTFSDKDISIKIFSILHQKLRMFRMNDDFFIKMGAFNQYNHINKVMLSQAIPRDIKSFRGIFEYVISNLVGKVDTNRAYILKEIDDQNFEIELKPTPVFNQAFYPSAPFSVYETFLYVLGHIKIIPTYFNKSPFADLMLIYNEQKQSALIKGSFRFIEGDQAI